MVVLKMGALLGTIMIALLGKITSLKFGKMSGNTNLMYQLLKLNFEDLGFTTILRYRCFLQS